MTQTQNTSQKNNKSALPEGWKEVKLGEVAEKMISGGTPSTKKDEYYGGNIPWIRTQEVNFNYIKDTEIKITELGLKNSSAKWIPENTVIIAMYGNSAGRVAYSKIKATTNQACCNFIADKNKVDSKFIFFNLLNRYSEIKGMANGAAQQNLNVGNLKNLSLLLPPLPEQKSIASILSSFDNKIELLQEENETLEEIGKTIFKEWFGKYKVGDELPEGWKVGKLGEIAKLKSGYAFKSKDFVEDNNKKALKIKDLKGNGKIDLSDVSSISNDIVEQERVKYFKLEAGDVVLAMSGNTTGKIGIVPKSEFKIYLNQRVGKFFVKDKKYNSFIYFFLMSGNYEDKILNMGYGSAQPNISPSQIENIDLIIPNNKKIEEFLNISDNLFKKIIENNYQIQTLKNLRDTLLSKLMSGEVRVKD